MQLQLAGTVTVGICATNICASDFPFQQSFEEVKTIAVALQLYHLSGWSVFPPEFFSNQQTPIGGDPFDPRSYSAFRL